MFVVVVVLKTSFGSFGFRAAASTFSVNQSSQWSISSLQKHLHQRIQRYLEKKIKNSQGLSLNNDRGMQWRIQTFRKEKGEGEGHPDPEIRGGGLKKKNPPLRPQFGLKIRGGVGLPGPFPGSVTGLETFRFEDEDEI